jgi:hypothetical protein
MLAAEFVLRMTVETTVTRSSGGVNFVVLAAKDKRVQM